MRFPRWLRTALLATAVAGVVAAAACGGDDDNEGNPSPEQTAATASASPTTSPDAAVPSGEGFLLVADASATAVHVYTIPEMELAGSLDGIRFDNHLGGFALEDGRVVFTDGVAQEILVMEVGTTGPRIVARVPAEIGAGSMWGAVDEAARYMALTSGFEDSPNQYVNIFDSETYENMSFPVELAADEELHAWIAMDSLVASVGGELRAWPLEVALLGEAVPPSDTLAVGLGSHGLATSHARGTIYLTTNDGFEGVEVSNGAFGDVTVIPWNADGLSGGRNARPRMASDGQWVYGAIAGAGPTEPENWAQRQQDIHMANLAEGSARRVNLALGSALRFQISVPFAMFPTVGEEGHFLRFLDVDPDSSTFQTLVASVELPPLPEGPVPGEPTSGKQSRSSAITPDGRFAFASHGNQGLVFVIDTATMEVVQEIEVPTPLSGGGYLMAYQPGSANWDMAFR